MTEQEKDKDVEAFTDAMLHALLNYFKKMELKSHIEASIVSNDGTEEYEFSFRKIDKI